MKPQLALLWLAMFAGAAQAQGGLTKSLPSGGGSSGDSSQDMSLTIESHKLYVGADYADTTLSVSDSGLSSIPSGKYTSQFVDIRAGYRVFSAIAVEAHVGAPAASASDDGGRLRQDQYYAAFVVPTATILSAFEMAFPLGYAHSRLQRDVDGQTDHVNLDSIAFGVNIEIPIRVFSDKLPDFRLAGGGMVYSQKNSARYYGFHYGLRYEFGL